MKLLLTFLLTFGLIYSSLAHTEQELIAAVLILESGSSEKDIRGMEAINEVINNRAKNGKISKSQVVTKRRQFSCLDNRTPAAAIREAKTSKRWNLALSIANGRTNHVPGASHYFADYITPPKWSKDMKFVGKIGKHLFYKEYDN